MKQISYVICALAIALGSFTANAKESLSCKRDEKLIYIDKAEGGVGATCIKVIKKAKEQKTELPCPQDSVSYIDKSEGGPGFYCECPQDKIIYVDKSEGGNGLTCAQ